MGTIQGVIRNLKQFERDFSHLHFKMFAPIHREKKNRENLNWQRSKTVTIRLCGELGKNSGEFEKMSRSICTKNILDELEKAFEKGMACLSTIGQPLTTNLK